MDFLPTSQVFLTQTAKRLFRPQDTGEPLACSRSRHDHHSHSHSHSVRLYDTTLLISPMTMTRLDEATRQRFIRGAETNKGNAQQQL